MLGLKVCLLRIAILFIECFFLTCFDFNISHLGPNDYARFVLDLKWNFDLDLKHNIILAFWETKSIYFCSKMLYCHHFYPKSQDTERNDLGQNIVLNCFDIEILYYGSIGFCWLGLYNSFTLYSKLYPHKFWLQNLSFGSKWSSSACFGPKMKFLFEFET